MTPLKFAIYLVVMAGVTYLVRMIPLVLFKKKIENRFVLSFLHYVPYAVLSVMTIPACLYATGSIWSAIAGLVIALILAYFNNSLIIVALGASLGVFAVEMIQLLI